MDAEASRVLNFWFEELNPELWFAKKPELDREILQKFLGTYRKVERCETFRWRATPRGRLAEVIVLDQFSRNIFRDTPEAFKNDGLALALSQEAIATGDDQKLDRDERVFLYMPFMHSESDLIHQEAVRLFSQQGLENSLEYELEHKVLIDRFGRYPYRNEILGRPSTKEELAYLKMPGSATF
ncbi:DUF924 family protein [Bdellovibrio sp. HCB288]|uniref:DUF924 family protein n=1 Tax=Bdellovibrio sp. HCB288 TaxID=3394355 RepID=UPI0039B62E33